MATRSEELRIKITGKLVAARKAKRHTQKSLSSELGISQQTYSDYETCKSDPNASTLYDICMSLNLDMLDVSYLISELKKSKRK